jgi:hypothetical protein
VLCARLIKPETEGSLLREEVRSILQSFDDSAWHGRLARAEAYLPADASSTYLAAAESHWHIWQAVEESLSTNDEAELVITDGLAGDLTNVHRATQEFSELARRDLLRPDAERQRPGRLGLQASESP